MAISPHDEPGDGLAAPADGDGTAVDGDASASDDATPVVDSPDERPASTAAIDEPDHRSDHWLRGYLRDHVVHAAVVFAFVAYPFVLQVLERTPLSAEAAAFLPGITFVIVVLYAGLFAASFDFVSGYTGYLSFGHAAFFGTGAYFVVLAANGKVPLVSPETPFMVTMVLGAFLAALVALVIGAVSFRLTGVYFAMITLGFAQVLYELIRNWDYVAPNPRGGPTVDAGVDLEIGVPYVDSLSVAISRLAGDSFGSVLGFDLNPTLVSYFALGAVALVCYFAMQRILHSPFGRVMIAIRENEERTRAVGYDVFRFKMGAFAASAFFAGVAGALFAGYARAISPETTYYFLVTADALIVTIIGGMGTLAGPFYGSVFHEWLNDVLSSESGGLAPYLRDVLPEAALTTDVAGVSLLGVIDAGVDGRAPLYLGIVFVLFVLFVPNGLLGSIRNRLGGTVAERAPEALRRYRR